MKKLLIKKALFAAIYAFVAVLIELITFAVLNIGVVPKYWGLDFALILAFSLIIFIIPSNAASITVSAVLILLQAALACVNEALMSMSGIVFGLTMLNLTKELGGVFNSDFVNWWLFVGMGFLFAATLTGMISLNKFMATPKQKFNRQAVMILLLCCLIGENASLLIYQTTVKKFNRAMTNDVLAYYTDDEYLYNSQFISSKAFRRFGTYGYYFMNVSNTLDSLVSGFKGGVVANRNHQLTVLDEYFQDGKMSSVAYGENAYTGALQGKNIVLIVIESGEWFGINQEYTPTLYSMATNGISFTEYYARDKTNHSEAMSILGSYPVESDPATDLKGHTLSFTLPNLLRSAGYTTNYFHANTGEFYHRDKTFGTGGIYGFDTAHFFENMPALDGYNNPNKDFYDFDKDATIVKTYLKEYTNTAPEDQAFFTMHMTISSHGHYDDLILHGDYNGTEDADNAKDYDVQDFEKYYERIDHYPAVGSYANPALAVSEDYLRQFSDKKQKEIYLRYKRFQAGMMDLDEAINALVNDLNERGELDDTAFFFYADHTAYYNNQNYFLKGVAENESWNTRLFNIPCFMWYGGSMNGDFTPKGDFYDGYQPLAFTATKDTDSPLQTATVTRFANSFDIVPTLLQLVGFDYNLNLYQGVSMFAPDLTSVFVSREAGIFSNNMYFDGTTLSVKDAATGVWTHYDYERELQGENGLPDEAKTFIRQSVSYYDKQKMLETLYEIDYFADRKIEKSYKGTSYVRFVKTEESV